MKALSQLVSFVISILVLALGVFLIYLTFQERPGEPFITLVGWLKGKWWQRFLPGLLVMAVGLLNLILIALAIMPRKRNVFAFSTSDGSVTVSHKAIKEYVAHICKGVQGIQQVNRIEVRDHRRKCRIDIRLALRSGVERNTIEKLCQEKIRTELEGNLGIANVHPININIDDLDLGSSRERSSTKPPDQPKSPESHDPTGNYHGGYPT